MSVVTWRNLPFYLFFKQYITKTNHPFYIGSKIVFFSMRPDFWPCAKALPIYKLHCGINTVKTMFSTCTKNGLFCPQFMLICNCSCLFVVHRSTEMVLVNTVISLEFIFWIVGFVLQCRFPNSRSIKYIHSILSGFFLTLRDYKHLGRKGE